MKTSLIASTLGLAAALAFSPLSHAADAAAGRLSEPRFRRAATFDPVESASNPIDNALAHGVRRGRVFHA